MSDTVAEGLHTFGVRFDDLVCDGVTCGENKKLLLVGLSPGEYVPRFIFVFTNSHIKFRTFYLYISLTFNFIFWSIFHSSCFLSDFQRGFQKLNKQSRSRTRKVIIKEKNRKET